LGTLPRTELDESFRKGLRLFYENIMKQVKPKVFNNDYFNSEFLAQWIQTCVKIVNDPSQVSHIPSMTENIMFNFFIEAREKGVKQYEENMNKQIKKKKKRRKI